MTSLTDEQKHAIDHAQKILRGVKLYGHAEMLSASKPAGPMGDGDLVLVERGLLGAACSAIDKKRDAPKVLEKLRAITFAPAAPAQSGEPMAWTADSLYDAIEEILLHHRISNLEGDDGEAYPLVDQLTTPGANSIESGKFEIRLICDAIYNKVLTVAAPQPAQTALSPDGRTIDKAMVKRLAVQHGLIPDGLAQTQVVLTEPVMDTDFLCIDSFAEAMKQKLLDARMKGRSGWQDCDPEDLSRMLREHVEKGDPRDVANFCMFLWWHRAAIAAFPAAPAQSTRDACQIDNFSSRVCQYGTRSCTSEHTAPAQPCGEDAANGAMGRQHETRDQKRERLIPKLRAMADNPNELIGPLGGAIGEREAMRKILNEQMAENRPFRAKRELPPVFYNGDTKRDPELRELANDSEIVRRSIESFALTAEKVAGPKLAVWYGSMPESNGKTNWTAILHRGDVACGMTIDMSEYPDRVRYEADRMRWMIGDLDKEPFILDYDADKHSGYVAEKVAQAEPVAWTSPDRLKRIAERNRHVDTIWPASMRDEGDVPLYTAPQPAQTAQSYCQMHCKKFCQNSVHGECDGAPAQSVESMHEKALDALKVADRFCDSLTSEVCPDDVAIPIKDALRALTLAAPQPSPTAVVLDDERAATIAILKRARYVRHEDLPNDVRVETETRAAYGNGAAWQDARDTEQRRLINEAIALLEARAASPQLAQNARQGDIDALFARVTEWVTANYIPFEKQNELFRILAAFPQPVAQTERALTDDARDAARYRHLRECNGGSLIIVQITGMGEDDQVVLTEGDADTAIDSALAAAQPASGDGE